MLRCADVGLLQAELLCENGFEQQLNWTNKRLRLRQFKIPGVPLETSCHIKLQLRSFNNRTERITADFSTRQSREWIPALSHESDMNAKVSLAFFL